MKFNHFCIIVLNLQEAIDFYVKLFNCEVLIETYDRREEELRAVWGCPDLHVHLAMLQGPEVRIELIENVHSSSEEHSQILPSYHTCFKVDDVDQVYKEFSEKGIQFLGPPSIIQGKVKIAFFRGPGNHLHEVLEVL